MFIATLITGDMVQVTESRQVAESNSFLSLCYKLLNAGVPCTLDEPFATIVISKKNDEQDDSIR